MRELIALYKQVRAQSRSGSGSVWFDQASVPDIGELLHVLGEKQFVLGRPDVSFDLGAPGMHLLVSAIAKARPVSQREFIHTLTHQLERLGKQVRIRRTGSAVGLQVDREFYPLLMLLRMHHAVQRQATGTLRSATKRGGGSLKASYFREMPSQLQIKGLLGAQGIPVQASFWQARGSVGYRISAILPRTADQYLLERGENPALEDVRFESRPIVTLSSGGFAASKTTMAVQKGVWFHTEYRFGQHLQSATLVPTPQVLTGKLDLTSPRPFELRSAPVIFVFGQIAFEKASLTIQARRNEDDHVERMAGLNGVCCAGPLRLPMRTGLPRDSQTLAWNTLADAVFDEDGHPLQLDGLQGHQFVQRIADPAELNPFMGGNAKWFSSTQRLANMIGMASPSHLLSAHLHINLITQHVTTARVDLYAAHLAVDRFDDLHFTSLIFTFSTLFPFGGGEKATLSNVHATLWLKGIPYDGQFRAGDMLFIGSARHHNVEAICQGLNLSPLVSLQAAQARAVVVRMNVFDRTVRLYAKMPMGAQPVTLV